MKQPTTTERNQGPQMRGPGSDGSLGAVVTPEKLLMDTAERLGRVREGWVGVHMHLSLLQPQNREATRLRIAVRVLDPLVVGYRSQIFLLGNSDIVILCRDIPANDLEEIVYKVRALFSKDPLAQQNSAIDEDPLTSWFDLERDFQKFFDAIQLLNLEEGARRRAQASQPPPPEPLTVKRLEEILAVLATVDVAPLVRRQAAVLMGSKSTADIVFQEFFFAMADVKKAIAPKIDIMANDWLFQYLAGVLDQYMLRSLMESVARHRSHTVSINMNLSTMKTALFQRFLDSLLPNQTLIVEIAVVDAFADLGAFFSQRDMLRSRGHKILLDRIMPLTLEMLDLTMFDADYLKLSWSPSLATTNQSNAVFPPTESIANTGPQRFVLVRCDTEEAVKWGVDVGIGMFQGRFVDAMLAAVTMSGCKSSHQCTFGQCMTRRAVIAGRDRGECTDHAMVDSLPTIRTQRRTPPTSPLPPTGGRKAS